MEDIYLHGIAAFSFPHSQGLLFRQLENILQSGALLSRRYYKNIYVSNIGFNGLDYVSLCDYALRDLQGIHPEDGSKLYTSYHCYIERTVSLLFAKQGIDAITPVLVPSIDMSDFKDVKRMETLGLSETTRYSDMPDEVQVKDFVSLQHLRGVTLPCSYLLEKEDSLQEQRKKIRVLLKKVRNLLEQYQYSVPVYNLEDFTLLESEDDIECLLERRRKNG